MKEGTWVTALELRDLASSVKSFGSKREARPAHRPPRPVGRPVVQHDVGLAGAAQRLVAHRARLREQIALAEADVVFKQVDHLGLGLDLLGDQADAEPAKEVRKV